MTAQATRGSRSIAAFDAREHVPFAAVSTLAGSHHEITEIVYFDFDHDADHQHDVCRIEPRPAAAQGTGE
jgi:hypothetical protein